MTTIRKIIESIDLEKQGKDVYASEDIADVFGINDYIEFDKRIKCVFLRPHYCTDSWVGIRAYFLDGEFVAISTQIGRKYDETFKFRSQESALKVRDYILSLIPKKELDINILSELDEEIEDYYSVDYAGQILHKSGIYNGEKVKIKRRATDFKDLYTATIVREDGKEKNVDCREIKLSYVDLS